MSKYEKIGGGTYGVYRKKKIDWAGVIAGIAFWIILVAVIANL